MHFSLVGDHPDGLAIALALAATGRHSFATYTGPLTALDQIQRARPLLRPQVIQDFEEVLADPAIEAIIVASPLKHRTTHLRRALQSERHVLCVCPVDRTPDIAYEAAMIQKDTGCVLLPLLPFPLHPAMAYLAQLIRGESSIGTFELLRCEFILPASDSDQLNGQDDKVTIIGWETLQALGGDLAEVSGFAAGTEIKPGEPLLVSGRFEQGGIFQITYKAEPSEAFAQFVAIGKQGRAKLLFMDGIDGPSHLFLHSTEESRHQMWSAWAPWPAMIEVFEAALAERSRTNDVQSNGGTPSRINWQTAIRCLELDDAARRSVERRRVSTLEYPEASEEVGFKGTMTLVGCGLLWLILVVVVLSRWEPRLGWIIIPILVLFLGLQLLRWAIPREGRH
jgi:predicted dehydrogenase